MREVGSISYYVDFSWGASDGVQTEIARATWDETRAISFPIRVSTGATRDGYGYG